jgi:hypothetical protein
LLTCHGWFVGAQDVVIGKFHDPPLQFKIVSLTLPFCSKEKVISPYKTAFLWSV